MTAVHLRDFRDGVVLHADGDRSFCVAVEAARYPAVVSLHGYPWLPAIYVLFGDVVDGQYHLETAHRGAGERDHCAHRCRGICIEAGPVFGWVIFRAEPLSKESQPRVGPPL